jgi:mono/diheme cytochrome c family protein
MSRSRIVLVLVAGAVAIVAWLWLSPPRWWLNYMKPVDLTDPVGAGGSVVADYACRQCHLIGGEGQAKGPSLDDVTDRLDPVSIRLWLRDPRSIKWNTSMPNFQLSDPEIEAILSYLNALDRTSD